MKLETGKLKRQRSRRPVVVETVEELIAQGKLRVVDGPTGVQVENKFLKLGQGASNPEGVYQCLRDLEAHCNRTGEFGCRTNTEGHRLAVMDGEGSCYMNMGNTTQKYRKGLKAARHEILLRKPFQRWFGHLKQVCREHLPRHLLGPMEAVHRERQHLGLLQELKSEDLWKALACGRNNFLNAHTDDDCCWSLTTVVSEVPEDNIVCYFVFPEMGDVVPLRHGDLLLFNPLECHCVSARRDGTKEAFCASFYINAGVAGENNRGVEVPGHIEEAAAALDSASAVGKNKQRRWK